MQDLIFLRLVLQLEIFKYNRWFHLIASLLIRHSMDFVCTCCVFVLKIPVRWLSAPTEVNAYYSPQFNQFGKNLL